MKRILSPRRTAGGGKYGVGISWMLEPVITGKKGEEGQYFFGRNVFGHGSATRVIIRVARDHELIVTMVRYTLGRDYEAHKNKFLQAISDRMVEK